MIEMYLHTRPNRLWVATATVQDSTYRAIAPEGASNKLARLLRTRGVPDQPLRVHNPKPGTEHSDYPSLHAWADYDHQKELRKFLTA